MWQSQSEAAFRVLVAAPAVEVYRHGCRRLVFSLHRVLISAGGVRRAVTVVHELGKTVI